MLASLVYHSASADNIGQCLAVGSRLTTDSADSSAEDNGFLGWILPMPLSKVAR